MNSYELTTYTVHAEPVNCPGTITETDSGAVLCNGELVREGDDSIGGAVTQTITSSAHGYAGNFFMTVATMLLMMVIGHQ